jgi:hypothetical protein
VRADGLHEKKHSVHMRMSDRTRRLAAFLRSRRRFSSFSGGGGSHSHATTAWVQQAAAARMDISEQGQCTGSTACPRTVASCRAAHQRPQRTTGFVSAWRRLGRRTVDEKLVRHARDSFALLRSLLSVHVSPAPSRVRSVVRAPPPRSPSVALSQPQANRRIRANAENATRKKQKGIKRTPAGRNIIVLPDATFLLRFSLLLVALGPF